MDINDGLIDKLSDLAKLEFEGEDREQIKHDLGRMLDFVNQLSEVDTEGVEPLVHMTQEVNRLRMDEPKDAVSAQEALKNAPKADSDYFRVPKFSKK